MSTVFNDQGIEFDTTKVTNLYSTTIKRAPIVGNELSTKKHIDEELYKHTFLRFDQTLEIFVKVSFGNFVYNLTKHDRTQMTDITGIKIPNIGFNLLQKRNIQRNDKNIVSNV